MGTNYYVNDDPTCNNPAHTEKLHIGKSSMGWKFGFHAIPEHEPPLTSWAAWQEFLAGRTIEDEYGTKFTLDEFRLVVEYRMAPSDHGQPICSVNPASIGFRGQATESDERRYHDSEGYDFFDGEFS